MDRTVRIALLVVVIALTAAAWFFTYFQFQNMGLLMQVGVPMSLGMEGSASAASFLAFTGMWLAMMVAMMLPSTYPTLLLHRTVYRQRTGPAFGATLLFTLSYFLVWTTSGVLFYSAYVLIGTLRQSSPGSESLILRAAGVALIVAGLYQWSWLKQACLKHCQNPLHFVMEHWHDGLVGALRMGTVHGVYCFGCCWGLMLILFVMGIMHLGWMAAIGALILVEKLVRSGRRISQAIGLVFMCIGIVVAVQPTILSQLSSQVLLGN